MIDISYYNFEILNINADNYLDRHVRPLNVRRSPGRWWPDRWPVEKPDVHKPEEKKEEPETKIEGGEIHFSKCKNRFTKQFLFRNHSYLCLIRKTCFIAKCKDR